MSLRLIEIIAVSEKADDVVELLQAHRVEGVHVIRLSEEDVLIRGVLFPEDVEELNQSLEPEQDSSIRRVLLTNVEAVIPKLEREEEAEKKSPVAEEEPQIRVGKFIRISKQELRDDIEQSANLNLNYLLMVVLSSVVAGIGILKDNVAIIIGAMVIAPFLGPSVALAFGSTIGDWPMTRRALWTALTGTALAISISVVWGLADPGVQEISHATYAEYRDVVLALTCGFAGVLSMMTGQATSLIGVMVAAALLPPLMRAGLFLGGQLWLPALNAFLIYLINIICVILAGITTFYLSGIRPTFWWEEENARHHRRRALLISLGILLLLVVTIGLIRHFQEG